MATTLRARLSLWNGAAFAVLLGAFAAATYAFVATATESRTDAYLVQTADAVGRAVVGAHADGAWTAAPSDASAAAAIVRRFRYRDIGVAVLDPIPAGAPPGAGPRPLATTVGDTLAYPFGGPWGLPRTLPTIARAVRAGTVIETLGEGPSAERVLATTVPIPASAAPGGTAGAAQGRVLVVGVSQSLGGQQQVLQEAREALIAGVILALFVSVAGGYAVTWWSLRPIEVISHRAARIEAGTLHERLPVRGEIDELARLATAFNGLLERLQRSFEQQRQFMADASHELRTPVAIVRGEAEYALAQPARPEEDYRTAFATVQTQSEVLARLVDDLFLLARANAGEQAVTRAPLWLEELTEECVRSVRTLAAGRGVRVTFLPDAELPVTGDERLLRRMLMNLLDNATKYTPRGGHVEVRVAAVLAPADAPPDDVPDAHRDAADEPAAHEPPAERLFTGLLAERWTAEHVVLAAASPPATVASSAGPAPVGPIARITVRDSGPGIPPEAQPHVFERFYRARQLAAAGPGDSSGAGLGLAIAAWVATAHGGRVVLVHSDGHGTEFAIELPLGAG